MLSNWLVKKFSYFVFVHAGKRTGINPELFPFIVDQDFQNLGDLVSTAVSNLKKKKGIINLFWTGRDTGRQILQKRGTTQ